MNELKNILEVYEAASGQAINLSKSEMFFNSNVIELKRNSISNMLGVYARIGAGKYLGMSSNIGRNRKSTFGFMKEKSLEEDHIHGWEIPVQSWLGNHDKFPTPGNFIKDGMENCRWYQHQCLVSALDSK